MITKIHAIKLIIVAVFLISYLLALAAPTVSLAQETSAWSSIKNEMSPIGKLFGSGDKPQDPRAIAAVIIRIFMSLLGILFICYIVYAGFIWMTAAGNDERIEKAKSTLRAGVIGIGIIIGAFAIASFVTYAFSCALDDNRGFCMFFGNI